MSDLAEVFERYARFVQDQPFPGSFKYKGRYLHTTIVEAALEELDDASTEEAVEAPRETATSSHLWHAKVFAEPAIVPPAADPIPPDPMHELLQDAFKRLTEINGITAASVESTSPLAMYYEGNAPYLPVSFLITGRKNAPQSSGIRQRDAEYGGFSYDYTAVLVVGDFNPGHLDITGSQGPLIIAPLMHAQGETVWLHVMYEVDTVDILRQLQFIKDHYREVSRTRKVATEKLKEAASKKLEEAAAETVSMADVESLLDSKLDAMMAALMARLGGAE